VLQPILCAGSYYFSLIANYYFAHELLASPLLTQFTLTQTQRAKQWLSKKENHGCTFSWDRENINSRIMTKPEGRWLKTFGVDDEAEGETNEGIGVSA
jgi:hypothetical protein